VYCPTDSLCLARSGPALEVTTDPVDAAPRWTAMNLPNIVIPSTFDSYISGLSCVSAQLCVAVDALGYAFVGYRAVLMGGVRRKESKEARSFVLIDRCGHRPLAALDDAYWQSLVDELVGAGKSYSRIATYLAVIRHVYAYARRANRRLVPSDPTREVAMPANDGKIRERVATAEEAARLIEALPAAGSSGALSWDAVLEIRASADSAVALSRRFGVSDALVGKVRRGELYQSPGSRRSAVASDRSGWALAFYTGMRRGEIGRSQWQHVFWEANELMVAASKSDAREGRRVPMVGQLKKILREEWIRRGQPAKGTIVVRSVDSGKWQARADKA
jgi:integrase